MRCDICEKELCETNAIKAFGKILCSKHYQQFLKFGKALDTNQRSTKDLNDFVIKEDGVHVMMYNQKCEIAGEFLIDTEDMDLVLSKKWRLWKGRVFTGNFHPITISCYLMQPNKDEVVDYINGNPLDNRRANLRITVQAKNVLNRAVQSNNTFGIAGIAGIAWSEERKKYEVVIKKNHKRLHLSRYSKLCDAVYVRYTAEVLLFGEYRSNRNDAIILPLVDQCQNKTKLYEYTKNKISQYFNI